MIENKPEFNQDLYSSIAKIIVNAKDQVYRNSNTILLKMYWEIGQLIIEDEQNGELRAKYGKSVLKNLANLLSVDLGRDLMKEILITCELFSLHFQFGTQCVPN